jgi:high-affinity nickel-transport protein
MVDEAALEAILQKRGLFTRLFAGLTRSITRPGRPGHMYPMGLLFGIGFDTASEVTLLVLAGAGASSGLPWYAIVVLPLLFAAGMSLLDTADGCFMNAAYIIGTIELVGLLRDDLGLHDPVTGWIAGFNLGSVGFLIVGLFILVWGGALAYWRLARVEQRWTHMLSGQQ